MKKYSKDFDTVAANNQRETKIKELSEKLENGVKELFNSDNYKNYLLTMSKFYNYSPRNTTLIFIQNPSATQVAGFSDWKKKFDRHVKKGEKGIQILAPTPFKVYIDKTDKHGNPILDKDGKPEKEEKERISFKVTHVFDVSQTQGKELPEIAKKLTANVENFTKLREALVKLSPVAVEFGEVSGSANGYFMHGDKDKPGKIVVKNDLSEAQTLKTLVHEITHANLHENSNAERNIKEIEAESTAFVVCSHLGIDSSDYSFGYVAGWSKDKNASELQEQLSVIQSAASKIIEQIDKELGLEKSVSKTDRQTEKQSSTVPKIDKVTISREQFDRLKGEFKVLRNNGMNISAANTPGKDGFKNIIFPGSEREKIETILAADLERNTPEKAKVPPEIKTPVSMSSFSDIDIENNEQNENERDSHNDREYDSCEEHDI